jgi:hypothetical protein
VTFASRTTWSRSYHTMRDLCEIGPDGEIFDDGVIFVPFPSDLELLEDDLFD